jgi:hypothetical protein
MRGKSLLKGAIVCLVAYGPLSAICGDTIVWHAWIDFAIDVLSRFCPKVIRTRAGQTGVERPAMVQISTPAQRRSS